MSSKKINTSNRIPLAQQSWHSWCSSTLYPTCPVPFFATASDARQQVSPLTVKHCSAEQAWQDLAFGAMSSSPKTISSDSTRSSSSPRLADVNETWTSRRCGQTRGEEDEPGEDKEMMTTAGDGGARPCHISHWMGGRRHGGEARSLRT